MISALTRLWIGQAVSTFGDALRITALPLLALRTGASVAQVTAITATSGFATLVTGVFAGHLVDRRDRRSLMITCDVARFVVVGAIALLWDRSGHDIRLLYLTAAVAALLGVASDLCYVALVPCLAGKEELVKYNARVEGSFALAAILGPIAVGFLSSSFSPTVALQLDALTFLVSGVFVSTLPSSTAAPAEDKETVAKPLAGFRFLLRDPVLRTLVILICLDTFFMESFTDLVIVGAKTELHESDAVVGLLLGARGVGGVAGALVLPWLETKAGAFRLFLGAWALMATAALVASRLGGAPSNGLALAAFGCGHFSSGVLSLSQRQARTPARLLGRVTAAGWTILGVIAPLGALAAGACASRYGTAPVLRAMGMGVALVFVLALASPLRRISPPEPSGGR